MENGQSAVFFLVLGCVSGHLFTGILPNYAENSAYSPLISSPFNYHEKRYGFGSSNVKRNVKSPFDDPYTLDGFSRKLKSQEVSISQDRMGLYGTAGAAPARSIKELEELMRHPVWITDTSKKKPVEPASKSGRNSFVSPTSPEGQPWISKAESDEHRDHIREIITKFQTYKPRPITDNRMTKFIFTHDGDVATSRAVQQHNREVEAAFAEFNKKLEETLSLKEKNAASGKGIDNKGDESDLSQSFNKVVSFLDKNINKLKDVETPHKQVCQKHNLHNMDEFRDEFPDGVIQDLIPLRSGELRKYGQIAQTRDGLESILLGLDRPRSGPFKRHAMAQRGSRSFRPVQI